MEEEAIVRVQEQLLFLERNVEQLDETVRDLAHRLDEMSRDLARVTHRVDQQQHKEESTDQPPDDARG